MYGLGEIYKIFIGSFKFSCFSVSFTQTSLSSSSGYPSNTGHSAVVLDYITKGSHVIGTSLPLSDGTDCIVVALDPLSHSSNASTTSSSHSSFGGINLYAHPGSAIGEGKGRGRLDSTSLSLSLIGNGTSSHLSLLEFAGVSSASYQLPTDSLGMSRGRRDIDSFAYNISDTGSAVGRGRGVDIGSARNLHERDAESWDGVGAEGSKYETEEIHSRDDGGRRGFGYRNASDRTAYGSGRTYGRSSSLPTSSFSSSSNELFSSCSSIIAIVDPLAQQARVCLWRLPASVAGPQVFCKKRCALLNLSLCESSNFQFTSSHGCFQINSLCAIPPISAIVVGCATGMAIIVDRRTGGILTYWRVESPGLSVIDIQYNKLSLDSNSTEIFTVTSRSVKLWKVIAGGNSVQLLREYKVLFRSGKHHIPSSSDWNGESSRNTPSSVPGIDDGEGRAGHVEWYNENSVAEKFSSTSAHSSQDGGEEPLHLRSDRGSERSDRLPPTSLGQTISQVIGSNLLNSNSAQGSGGVLAAGPHAQLAASLSVNGLLRKTALQVKAFVELLCFLALMVPTFSVFRFYRAEDKKILLSHL